MTQQHKFPCSEDNQVLNLPQDRTRFKFQNDWFEQIRPEWDARTCLLRSSSKSKSMRILELGCFEGASTTWILENLASHATTTVTVVDSFEGGMEHQAHELDFLEFRFRENVNKCANASKLQVIKDRTEHALIKLRSEQAKFDFIYIDASHVAIDVLHDAVLCWSMLNQGGTLVFDDWTWKGYMEDVYNPRMAITAFLECAAPEIKVQETESQIWITRVENHIPATKNHDPTLWYGNGSPLKFLLDSSDGAKQGSIAPSA